MDPILIVFFVLLAGSLTINVLYTRRQKQANGPKWAALAKLVGGTSTDTDLQGYYQGRGVSAGMSQQAAGRSFFVNGSSINVSDQLWVYQLRMGAASSQRQGKSFEVDLEKEGPRMVSGNEEAWQQVLTVCGTVNFAEAGFTSLKFSSDSGEVSGTMVKVAMSMKDDVKLSHFTTFDMGPIPTPAQFQGQLDVLLRVAEANERVNAAVG